MAAGGIELAGERDDAAEGVNVMHGGVRQMVNVDAGGCRVGAQHVAIAGDDEVREARDLWIGERLEHDFRPDASRSPSVIATIGRLAVDMSIALQSRKIDRGQQRLARAKAA